jgi:hypothetical protein
MKLKLNIEVEHTDGQSHSYEVGLSEWSKWERKTGKSVYAIDSIKAMQQSDFLLLAHFSYVRQSAGKPTKPFEVWEMTIDAIQIVPIDDPKATPQEVSTEQS